MKNLNKIVSKFQKALFLVLFMGLGNLSHALVAGGGFAKGLGAWRAEYMYNITGFTDAGAYFYIKVENGGAGGYAWLNKGDSDQCGNKIFKAYQERVNHCNTSIGVNVYGFGAHHDGIYEADMWQCGLYNDSNVDYCGVKGCTDPGAPNYNASATRDDGSCTYFAAVESNPVGTHCQMTITSCPNHPEYATTFYDYYNKSALSKEACLQRAKDFNGSWCGNSASNPVTATYLSGSTVVASLTYPTPSGKVLGKIEGLVVESSVSTIKGWACGYGLTGSIGVHLYSGAAAGAGGTFVGAYTANLASSSAETSECGTTGTAYRFSIPLTNSIRAVHANKAIYVHGISPTNQPNSALSGSGTYLVPAADATSSSSSSVSSQSSSQNSSYDSDIDDGSDEFDNRINYITNY